MAVLDIGAPTSNQFTLAYWATSRGKIETAVNGIDKNNIAANYKILEFLGSMPAAGNAQRAVVLTANDGAYIAWKIYIDNGAAFVPANNVLYASVYDLSTECNIDDILKGGDYGFRWGCVVKVSSGSEFTVSKGSILINGKKRHVTSAITCGVGNIQGGGAFAAGTYEVYAIADTADTKTIDTDDIRITKTSADVTGTYTNYRLIGYVEYVGSAIQGASNVSEVVGLSKYESVIQGSTADSGVITFQHNLGDIPSNISVYVRNTAAEGNWYLASQAQDGTADHKGISVYDVTTAALTVEVPDGTTTPGTWYGVKAGTLTAVLNPSDIKVIATL